MSASAAETLLHQEEKSCETILGSKNSGGETTIVKNNNNNKTTSAEAVEEGGEFEASPASIKLKTSENTYQTSVASTTSEALTTSGNTAAATYARNLLLVHK